MPSLRGYLRHRARLIRQADAEFVRASYEKQPLVAAELFAAAAKLYKDGDMGLLAAQCYAKAAVICGEESVADRYRESCKAIRVHWGDVDEIDP